MAWITFLRYTGVGSTVVGTPAFPKSYESGCGPPSWPGLVGTDPATARGQILRENQCVTGVPVLVEGSQVSREYDPTRVRLYVDAEAQISVVLIPAVGN
jgi:hypothetical protein